jgi:hypothetical protein
VRKLGFQLVRPLEARVGLGRIGTPRLGSADFERVWSADALAWRCANPNNPVRARQRDGVLLLDAAAAPGVRAYGEVAGSTAHAAASGLSPLRLYLGLMPDGERGTGAYLAIPKALRPSPLNLIYRSLSGRAPQLDSSNIRFSFIDFDAY